MERKELLRNFGIALLGWLLGSAGAFLAFWLQFSHAEKLDTGESGLFLPSWYWQVHPVCYGLGGLLSLAVLTAVWRLLLRRTLFRLLPLKKGWLVLWSILALLALFVQFMLFLFSIMITIGLFDKPYPKWTIGFIFVYLGYALILIGTDTFRHIRRKKTEAVI